MQTVIPVVAILCAIGCLAVFAVVILRLMPAARERADNTAKRLTESNKSLASAPAPQLAEVLRATASLSDSMVKTSPASWSLIGALLFLLIAAFSSGLIGVSAQTATGANTANTAETQANNVQGAGNTAENEANPAPNAAAQ